MVHRIMWDNQLSHSKVKYQLVLASVRYFHYIKLTCLLLEASWSHLSYLLKSLWTF
jgi:hypothetical protein